MVLLDGTVWIDLLGAGDSIPVRRLRALLESDAAAVAPVIVQELLQGPANPDALAALRREVLNLPLLASREPLTTYLEAASLYARCRWAGITPRSPHDCPIAQTAIELDVPPLHDDRDFIVLAEVEPRLRLETP